MPSAMWERRSKAKAGFDVWREGRKGVICREKQERREEKVRMYEKI